MQNTPFLSLVLVLVASLLGAAGQFLFQNAANRSEGPALLVFTNPRAILGMICYVTIMVLFTYAFRIGGTVRVLYHLYASTFVWAAMMAMLYYGEPIRPIHGMGMVLLIAGITMMSW